MRVIEVNDHEEVCPHPVEGRTIPAACLLEDNDGIRIALVPDSVSIPTRLWAQAHAAGARMLVAAHPNGWEATTVEEFMATRDERRETQTYVNFGAWHGFDEWLGFPSYRTLRERIEESARQQSIDKAKGGFVHLHAHSEYSPLDGLSKVKEMIERAVADDQHALALTDHGVCAGHPTLQKEATEAGIKPVFGIEANFVNDRFLRGDMIGPDGQPLDASKVLGDYFHFIMWAETQKGLQNLWGASTEANLDGFYGRPRMDWDTIARYSEGVMASTACLRGPLADKILKDDEEGAKAILARLMSIYGDGLWVELHTNQLEEQKKLNLALISMANDFSLPTIAVVDAHYPCKEDQANHQVWIAAQTNKDLQDEGDLFVGSEQYHVMTEAEVRSSLSYLPKSVVDEAIHQTTVVADRCHAEVVGVAAQAPVFSKVGGPDADVKRLTDLCLSNWGKTEGKRDSFEVYSERFETEMKLLIDKGFCGYFLMVADYCMAAKEGRISKSGRPILVGPGRGSGGGSLVAYLCGITEIDAVEADLLFGRFLTEGRTELPDFDVDFPTSARTEIQDYITERYGAKYVMRVGTHGRYRNKGVVRDLARVLASQFEVDYKDLDSWSAFVTDAESDTAGLGMPWEEMWETFGDLPMTDKTEMTPNDMRRKYPELFAYADRLVGRLKSYGRHAAGMVIATGTPLTGRYPMRVSSDEENRQPISEFDMKILEMLGLVKFDLLTLRTLDTLQWCLDLIYERTGKAIDVYSWKEEYEDDNVWDMISSGYTLGCFQIETAAMTTIVKRQKPRNLSDLSDAITIVRPGPKRSGLTETYFRRRAGQEPITFPDPRLEQVLAKSFGCILYQEDVMQTCMVLGGYSENEADGVRKILGKKQVEKVQKAGEEFVTRTVDMGMVQAPSEHLWAQMAEFAKYSFNRAHAWGYGLVAYWCAWFKYHYPVEFLTAVLSTVDAGRIPDFVQEARRMGYRVLPPDINESGMGFRATDEGIRYGLDAVKKVGESAVSGITPGQPYSSFTDFLERKGSKCNAEHIGILVRVGAFDTLEPNRRALEAQIDWKTSGEQDRCVHKDEQVLGPGGLPCTFDWSSVPVKLGKSGKPVKNQPGPPKRCTRACRSYEAQGEKDWTSTDPYTDADIRERELEMLGAYVSSTPFDRIPEDVLAQCLTAEQVEKADHNITLTIAGIITKVKPYTPASGRPMGFLAFNCRDGEIDVTVFNDQWKQFQGDLRPGRLCFAYIQKNDRGAKLSHLVPV